MNNNSNVAGIVLRVNTKNYLIKRCEIIESFRYSGN